MQRILFFLFAVLLFLTPLILWPFTSEVFEFNKMVVVYTLTVLISGVWLTRCILEKKFIFSRTIIDAPLLIFFASQLISTFLSIDFYTSVFGYYSRFNGGLLSLICYSVVYWAFVSNLGRDDTKKLVCNYLLPSAFIVSLYAVAQHFGIDKNLWVQDVQNRVFSTLGQPNWLAAWVVAIIPVVWAIGIQKFEARNSKLETLIYFGLSILFFCTLLFTKSRSGLLGFLVADLIFWSLYLWQKRKEFFSRSIVPFVVSHLSLIGIVLVVGTAWTPSIGQYLNDKDLPAEVSTKAGTSLETGGTESGTIRKIVWKGAIEVWKNYPIFGTGVETFAYSYYGHRPIEHNLTSEWDFIYNKAHNEFLNYAANTGTFGLISYFLLIIFSCYQILKNSKNLKPKESKQLENNNSKFKTFNIITDFEFLNFGVFAGYISILVTNFFGFSVVPTQLLFFLFPAFGFSVNKNENPAVNNNPLTKSQKFFILLLLLTTSYLLLATFRYWYSDILYAKGKAQNSVNRSDLAYLYLQEAVKNQPDQPVYLAEEAVAYSSLALALSETEESTNTAELTNIAESKIQSAIRLSPSNINLKRQMFGIFVRLSVVDEKYLALARDILMQTIKLAPTDPKLYFNLGVIDANLDNLHEASEDFRTAIDLKPNYIDARIQYAAILVHLKNLTEAKNQLEYILENLDPQNETARQALENIR